MYGIDVEDLHMRSGSPKYVCASARAARRLPPGWAAMHEVYGALQGGFLPETAGRAVRVRHRQPLWLRQIIEHGCVWRCASPLLPRQLPRAALPADHPTALVIPDQKHEHDVSLKSMVASAGFTQACSCKVYG